MTNANITESRVPPVVKRTMYMSSILTTECITWNPAKQAEKTCSIHPGSVVVKDLWFKDKNKDKDLGSEDRT